MSGSAEVARLVALLRARHYVPRWATDGLAVADWLQLDGQDRDPDWRRLVEALRAVYAS